MKQKKLVSVAEFAKLAEMPKAKVYSILEKAEYRNYISVNDGLKMVDVALLDVLNGNIPEAKESAESQPKTADKPHLPHDEASTNATITALSAEIEELKATIAEKDRQIQDLSLRLAEMAQKSQDITEKALNAVNQQQILTAMTQKKMPWYKRLLPIGRGKTEIE